MKFHCRLTAFLRLIYLINLDQYSPAIPSLRRQKNNLNCPPFFSYNPIRRLRVAKKTCLTVPLEYKYRVIIK